jgi:hypothetical protein
VISCVLQLNKQENRRENLASSESDKRRQA